MSTALLPDTLWNLIEPLLPLSPRNPKGGRSRLQDRACLTGIPFALRSGIGVGDAATGTGAAMALESNLKGLAAYMLLTQATAEALFGEPIEARKTPRGRDDPRRFRTDKGGRGQPDGDQRPGSGGKANHGSAPTRESSGHASQRCRHAFGSGCVTVSGRARRSGGAQLGAGQTVEFGRHAGFLPNYTRAMAYLRLRRADEAAAECKAVLDHRGVSPMSTTWEMSQLGLARAHTLQADTAKAKTADQDFFARWKDADPDIPILKQAKAE